MKMSSVISLTSCIFFDGIETSLAVQWLRLQTSNAWGTGLSLVSEQDPACSPKINKMYFIYFMAKKNIIWLNK